MEQSGSISKNNSSSSQNNRNICDSYVRKLMLDTWSRSIFSEIKYRLQNSAMKIIYSERIGEAFDSLLVVGVRESYGNNIIILMKQSLFIIKLVYLLS